MEKIALLTGAGFTKNFGGLLGDQIWSLLYSNPKLQSNDKLRSIFLERDNSGKRKGYEEIYGKVLDPAFNYSQIEKDIIKLLINEIYSLQERLIECQSNKWQHITHALGRFIGSFVTDFFTLNQDLFIEKELSKLFTNIKHNHVDIKEPQIPSRPRLYLDTIQLPSSNSVNKIEFDSNNIVRYFKLHGSINWFDSITGKNKVIIGGGDNDKREQIEKEPLLIEYLEYFERCLGDYTYLLIIGYSFHDYHINNIIESKIVNNNLKVIVIDKSSPGNDILDNMLPIKDKHYIVPSPNPANKIIRARLASRLYGLYLVDSLYDLFILETGKANELFKVIVKNMDIDDKPLFE